MSLIPPGGNVIYDGDCGICTHTIRLLRHLDWAHRLTFFSNSDPNTFDKFPEVTLERSREEILAQDPRTGWYGGFQACEWIACRVPLLWILVPLTLIPGIDSLGNKIYKKVARNRHKISAALGLKACKIN
jgi:predicted DCC family thiol-disulfide oxidoreductase YuxK